jgi:hypothetical protein
MTKDDKQDAAWRLVKLGVLSKAQIREVTTVATSNVANMRRVLRKLQELERPEGAIPLAELTWKRALREDYYAPEDGGKALSIGELLSYRRLCRISGRVASSPRPFRA